jgi:hypothetical protein
MTNIRGYNNSYSYLSRYWWWYCNPNTDGGRFTIATPT